MSAVEGSRSKRPGREQMLQVVNLGGFLRWTGTSHALWAGAIAMERRGKGTMGWRV